MSARSSRHARRRRRQTARRRSQHAQHLRQRLHRIGHARGAHDDHAADGHAERNLTRRSDDTPPRPPLQLTPLVACDPATDMDVLWHIAREAPELRRWLVANPRADAALLEFVAQAGGPGVREALTLLLDG